MEGLGDAPPRHFRVKWFFFPRHADPCSRPRTVTPTQTTPGLHHALLQGGIARADELKLPLVEAWSPSLFVHLKSHDPLRANKSGGPFSRATNLPTGGCQCKTRPKHFRK
jgi:hypothetical protein